MANTTTRISGQMPHDWIGKGDRCELAGCTLGVLEHLQIPDIDFSKHGLSDSVIPRVPFRLNGKQMFDDGDLLIATFEKAREGAILVGLFNIAGALLETVKELAAENKRLVKEITAVNDAAMERDVR